MRRIYFLSLLILTLCGWQTPVRADHIMGSDITYKCVGNDSFLVTITMYRDCNGCEVPPCQIPNLQITSPCGTKSVSTTLTVGADITPVCKSSCTRCTNSSCSFPYGIQVYLFTTIVHLPDTCCNYTLSWSSCCRNLTITTGLANGSFYVNANLNKCAQPCNSSPRFTNPPLAVLCAGQCFIYNQGVVDDDGDSLVYSFAPPLLNNGSAGNYTSPYSYDKPIYFLGFPNASLPFNPPQCRGFHLDSATGDLMFKPMVAQQTVFAMKVEEYRNGVKIGETRRDIQIIVLNCPANNAPVVSGMDNKPVFNVEVCAGSQLCFTVHSDDQDNTDTVSMSWNGGIPGATFTTSGGRLPTGTFCWTPKESDASSVPYFFTVQVQDDACPVRATTIRSYRILVKPLPKATDTITANGCGNYSFSASTTPLSALVEWRGVGGMYADRKSFNHQFQQYGKLPYSLTITAIGCNRTYHDTLDVPEFTTLDLGPDTVLCEKEIIQINPVIQPGEADSFLWSNGATTGSIAFQLIKDTMFTLSIKDTIGCYNQDSVVFKAKLIPDVDAGPDQRICGGDSFLIKPVLNLRDTLDSLLTYRWTNLSANTLVDTVLNISLTDSGIYELKVSDSIGCSNTDTIRFIVNPEVNAIATPTEICIGDTATLSVNELNYQYFWYKIGSPDVLVGKDRETQVNPLITTTYRVLVRQNIGGVICESMDTVTVKVHNLPAISFGTPPSRCVNGSTIPLSSLASPVPGIWSGTGVMGTSYSPSVAGPGTHWLVYQYTAPSTGCTNYDSVQITVHPLPEINLPLDYTLCTHDLPSILAAQPAGGTWSGNGVLVNGIQYQFDPAVAGPGTHQLIYTLNDLNNCTNKDTLYITVYQSPDPKINKPADVCIGAPAIPLSATPSGGIFSGLHVSGQNFIPAVAGTFVIKYEFQGAGGCVVIDSTTITVNPLPQVTVSAAISKVCVNGDPVVLNGASSSPGNGTWTGPGVSGSQFDPGIAGAGNFYLNYIFTDNYGCINEDSVNLNVQELPVVNISGTPVLCKDAEFKLNASYTGAAGISWITLGDGVFSDMNGLETGYTPGTNDQNMGYFDIKLSSLSVANNVCETVFDSARVEMHPTPKPDFIADTLRGCSPLTVKFSDRTTIAEGSIAAYAWEFGDGNSDSSQSPMHTFEEAGLYDVKLWVQSDKSCKNEVTMHQYIEVLLVPDAAFSITPEITTIDLPEFSFNDKSSKTINASYKWFFDDFTKADGGTSQEQHPVYAYSDTGQYHVRMIVTNDNGCSDTAQQTAVVLPEVLVFVPNVFSPNLSGPSANETFRIRVFGIESFVLQVYNRWGELLYETNDPDNGWNGTYSGEPVGEDVYLYVVKVTDAFHNNYSYTGTVTLLR
ncbi:MAG: PKD domain-containing protein [Bacteroidia bacterium]